VADFALVDVDIGLFESDIAKFVVDFALVVTDRAKVAGDFALSDRDTRVSEVVILRIAYTIAMPPAPPCGMAGGY
jgi:hypothetical protein